MEAKIPGCQVGNSRRKFRLDVWIRLDAVAMLTIAIVQIAQPTAMASCSSSSVTIVNQNPFPIWLGETVTPADQVLTPPSNNWEINSGNSVSLCLPSNWTSGSFWARTECNFAGTFGQDPNYKACQNPSGCTSNHICYGGMCVISCSTNTDCSGLPSSICVTGGNATPIKFCGFSTGVVCRTGDCGNGMYQCEGTWDGTTTQQTSATPASLFEITTKAGVPNYDVSNNSGYNNPIDVSVSGAGSLCSSVACGTNLNATCPSLLQIIEPPTSTVSSLGCGTGEYCQSGTCEACPSGATPAACVNGKTCVIGCNAPSGLCGNSYPPPVYAPGIANLECTTTIPSGTVHGVSFTADGSQYQDMYLAKNASGAVTMSNIGTAMFSGNQGTPTCWGDIDCNPNQVCLLGSAATGISGLPSYVGICALPASGGGMPTINNSSTNCASISDVFNSCGGYPNSGVYTCVAASKVNPGVACLPAFDPATVGLGTYNSDSLLFTGIAAPINPEWEATALWAAGNGTSAGTLPYYETFSNACPNQYAWQYDDHAGGLSCTGIAAFDVAFGKTLYPSFFNGQINDNNGIWQLNFPNGTFFGYYGLASYPYLYQYGLGWEYVYNANDGASGVYFWDSSLNSFLYTNPSDFPFLYDFSSSSWLYYYSGTSRYFYDFGGRGLFFSAPG
ncbi:MAG TPA: thaumatin family protein [Terriglobales bacterium]